ncbi:dTDP-4-dehydrorhamnose reductase family protein [Pseudohoeflea coraliihabitans]|uniref:dTDP-4-dehydrorhamnose reductase n=1 Tax=Pseudohoeflea coraliihabitans TaxID=2860393 RepID=A0ABS6WMU3_9HYPH|nr:SDR family oxidoreductase [Pseudohoeflea sp. DP4N28-3]MBW3097271.1 SDR family oxidoreductase [Pseudohoeflea sp. DP4N28-3]
MKVLVLGATGMLGHVAFRLLSDAQHLDVWGTCRSPRLAERLPEALQPRLISGVDAGDPGGVAALIAKLEPEAVINCIGLIKQRATGADPLAAIPLNALFPHQMARVCQERGARFIHISTDCVFDGACGAYSEMDAPTARDVYGLSKLLGETTEGGALTLRTSIIGPELEGNNGLLQWFLAQNGEVSGYTRAIFSGLPTVELARLIRDHVLPKPDISGLYHVAGQPIAKHDLLQLFKRTYGSPVTIKPDPGVVIDRSLDASRFSIATGYVPPAWPDLIEAMRVFG